MVPRRDALERKCETRAECQRVALKSVPFASSFVWGAMNSMESVKDALPGDYVLAPRLGALRRGVLAQREC